MAATIVIMPTRKTKPIENFSTVVMRSVSSTRIGIAITAGHLAAGHPCIVNAEACREKWSVRCSNDDLDYDAWIDRSQKSRTSCAAPHW